MPKKVQLKPGWLDEQLADIPHRLAYSHSPQECWRYGLPQMTAPLHAEDAKLLRQAMARRYEEWTGRALWQDLYADR